MRKCVGLLLVVCLMASSAFATNSWNGPTGSWGAPSLWSNGFVPVDSEQIKIKTGTTCDLDVAAGTFGAANTNSKITVGTASTGVGTLNVKSGGSITSVLEIQVSGGTGQLGAINQTGGTVNLNGTSSKDSKLELGYKSSNGTYTISGGTIATNGYSQLQVGASGSGGNTGVGQFTVDGTGGTIGVGYLYVGTQDATESFTGTGTLEFKINGGVSAINVAKGVYIDPTGTAAAVANLLVSKTGALPGGNIVLVNNTDNAVVGQFDAMNGGSAAEGATVLLGTTTYTLTYMYDAVSGTVGTARSAQYNDIALIIPEPATISLLGLGLLALRRNKK